MLRYFIRPSTYLIIQSQVLDVVGQKEIYIYKLYLLFVLNLERRQDEAHVSQPEKENQ